MNNKFVWILGICIGLWIFTIGYKAYQMKSGETNKPVITASFYPLAELARQVGGENVVVKTIVPAGTEPHDYEPSVQQVAEIYRSALFIYNGGGIDSWAERLTKDLRKDRIVKTINNEADPHRWLDPVLAASDAGRIAQALQRVNPGRAKEYQKNLKRYQAELLWLDKQFRMVLSNCRKRDFITSHEAFSYLAKRYNLTVYPISGINAEEEPSPGKLAEIAKLARKTNTKYIFFETLASPKIAETIARETDAQVLPLNPLEGLTEAEISAGQDYISVQQMNLNNLKIALECH